MKLGTETGNLITHVLTAPQHQPTPAVGDGATMCYYTDRHAGTIVKVTRTQVHVQRDVATRADGNGMSDAQRYTYDRDPDGAVTVFRLTKRGYRSAGGTGLIIGARREFYDFTF
jgi:hypothetical protein